MMIITPETWNPFSPRPDIFLAGGITGCPDWQADAIQMLTELGPDNLVVANPRRQHPIPSEGGAAMEQITWEWRRLLEAPVILFWFAPKQIQPIALMELSKALAERRNIVIGADPGYPRRFDVVVRCALENYGQVIAETLEDTVADAVYQLDRVKGGSDERSTEAQCS
ncbi:hypothetical protein GZ998_08870 [Actinomyces sp. 594]|uniref:nucleoside 2-deoxyribosyltransferase domain-containing protein n=1 Tax=Actinomyces sp. 594 TaxID=2057793 RepID=UPI001C572810|nr:nucleoside 2-deoxyribosyltransferase domain-containing protein [Actinomyces sp. 594]MBW3069612.1 hypothetical protein [Actinomyces sp. 594]